MDQVGVGLAAGEGRHHGVDDQVGGLTWAHRPARQAAIGEVLDPGREAEGRAVIKSQPGGVKMAAWASPQTFVSHPPSTEFSAYPRSPPGGIATIGP